MVDCMDIAPSSMDTHRYRPSWETRQTCKSCWGQLMRSGAVEQMITSSLTIRSMPTSS